ncbi:MAG: hypothetical protein V3V61_01855, partial [Gammaproteobacteria bacterium]
EQPLSAWASATKEGGRWMLMEGGAVHENLLKKYGKKGWSKEFWKFKHEKVVTFTNIAPLRDENGRETSKAQMAIHVEGDWAEHDFTVEFDSGNNTTTVHCNGLLSYNHPKFLNTKNRKKEYAREKLEVLVTALGCDNILQAEKEWKLDLKIADKKKMAQWDPIFEEVRAEMRTEAIKEAQDKGQRLFNDLESQPAPADSGGRPIMVPRA